MIAEAFRVSTNEPAPVFPICDGRARSQPMNIIETDRVFLRDWVLDDWTRFRNLASDLRVLKYIGTSEPWSDERTKRFVEGGIRESAKRGWVMWPVISKEDWRFAGICGFDNGFPPDVELGWWLAPQYWGRGIATEMASAVMRMGFEKFGFPKLISVAHSDNKASLRIMQKLGMAYERNMSDQGCDLVVYAKVNPSLPRA